MEAMQGNNSLDEVQRLIGERLPAITQSFDLALNAGEARSQKEVAIRQALYYMLIGFECSKNISRGNTEDQKKLEKKFIEMTYEPTGHLPKE